MHPLIFTIILFLGFSFSCLFILYLIFITMAKEETLINNSNQQNSKPEKFKVFDYVLYKEKAKENVYIILDLFEGSYPTKEQLAIISPPVFPDAAITVSTKKLTLYKNN